MPCIACLPGRAFAGIDTQGLDWTLITPRSTQLKYLGLCTLPLGSTHTHMYLEHNPRCPVQSRHHSCAALPLDSAAREIGGQENFFWSQSTESLKDVSDMEFRNDFFTSYSRFKSLFQIVSGSVSVSIVGRYSFNRTQTGF